jgi:hypothetical protein
MFIADVQPVIFVAADLATAFGSKPDTGADPKQRESIQSDEFVGDGRRGL